MLLQGVPNKNSVLQLIRLELTFCLGHPVLKVYKVTTQHKKLPYMNQHYVKRKLFLPQELEEGPSKKKIWHVTRDM